MTDRVDAGWSVQEFFGLDLGDARLNRRLLVLVETFGAQPQAPINQASADWQDTKAAYAFFANPARPLSRDLAAASAAHTRTYGCPSARPGDPGHLLSQLHPSSGNQRLGADWWRATWPGDAFDPRVYAAKSAVGGTRPADWARPSLSEAPNAQSSVRLPRKKVTSGWRRCVRASP